MSILLGLVQPFGPIPPINPLSCIVAPLSNIVNNKTRKFTNIKKDGKITILSILFKNPYSLVPLFPLAQSTCDTVHPI